MWGSILGFCVEKPPPNGRRDPRGGEFGGVGFHFWGSLGDILGFCVENSRQMGLGDPNAGGFGGGSPFLGVSVGLLGLILGFCVENPPEMGLGDPNVGDLGGGPHFWGSLGVDFGVPCGEPPPNGAEGPQC